MAGNCSARIRSKQARVPDLLPRHVLLGRVHVDLADAALRPWQRNFHRIDQLENPRSKLGAEITKGLAN